MARMLNEEQAQELVHTIEKALESLPNEVLAATVWVGRRQALKLAFGRGSITSPWLINTNDLWGFKYEAENGRLEVTC